MSEEEHKATIFHEPAGRLAKHKFIAMIGGSIVIALLFVSMSLALYSSSGAAQLDLSRPGYKSAEVKKEDATPAFEGFSASGSVDKKTLEEFEKMYRERTKNATSVDAFSGEVLDAQALGIAPDAAQ